MAQQQSRPVTAVGKLDPVWARIRDEANDIVQREPEIGYLHLFLDPAPRHARDRGRPSRLPSGSTMPTCRPG